MISDTDTNGTFYLKVDDRIFSVPIISSNASEVYWKDVCSTILDVGEHTIGVVSKGKMELDKLAIYLSKNGSESLDQLFKTDSDPQSVQIAEDSPCSYTVSTTSTRPFLLTFTESFHTMWKAYVDGQEISSINTDFIVNGYYIKKTGTFEIELRFVGQTYAEIGLVISGASAVAVAVIVSLKYGPCEKRLRRIIAKWRL
jgi:hypothetical protein